MTGGFTADADRLAHRSADFAALADRARRIADDLRAALEAAEAPWGRDAVGTSFAAAHAEPAERSRALVDTLAEGLGSVGARFAAAAVEYRDADADASAGLEGSARRLDALRDLDAGRG